MNKVFKSFLMAFEKTKIMRAAERYLSQGRISSAINEYKLIVENDSSEVNTQNMLGDLYMKADDRTNAIACYTQAAEYYHSSGFEKKAIAVYNKIHRLEPKSNEISLKLAELYQVRGSMAEARAHYDKVAEAYEKGGKTVDALTIWESIADIAPNDPAINLKIADFYWENNQKEEAARSFIEAGTKFAENEQNEEAAAAFGRALEVIPEDVNAVRGFVHSQVSLGYPEEAIKILDDLISHDPNNADVVFLLADCYLDMDLADKAEVILVDLVANEPKAFTKLLDLVNYYLKVDGLDDSVRILSMISEQLLVSQKPERLLDLLNEIIARNPEQIQSLRLLTRYYIWHKNELELKRALEQLRDASNFSGSVEDERYAVTQLLLLSPQEDKYISRLKRLNGVESAAEEDLLNGEEFPVKTGVPTFESFSGLLNPNEDDLNGSAAKYTGETAEITLTEDDLRPVVEEVSEVKVGLDIDEQIENLRFYIDQGYIEIAEETIKELDAAYGVREEFNEVRDNLARLSKDSGEKVEDVAPILEITRENSEESTDEYVVEQTSGKEIGLSDAKESDEKIVDEPDVRKETDTAQKNERSALNDSKSDSYVSKKATAKKKNVGRQKSDAREVSEAGEEYENHYHHAVAYKEMGLLEDSVREFTAAVECLSPDDGSERFLQCCILLGHCFVEQNLPGQAISWFEKAFEVANLDDAEKIALNYEIASAYAQDCNYRKAMTIFEEVFSTDADYRDVTERLEECREHVGLVVA